MGFSFAGGMSDEVPYWNPLKLYALSLNAVVDMIKERFSGGNSDALIKAGLTFPTSICNQLVARFVSDLSSKDVNSKSLLSAILDSPWCRLTKVYLKFSRDHGHYYFLMTRLSHYSLTELSIEFDDSTHLNIIYLTDIGQSLGNTLASLTLKHCAIGKDLKELEHALNYLVKLVQLRMHFVAFSEVRACGFFHQNKMPVLPQLEMLDFAFASGYHEVTGNIFTVQKNVKVLRLYGVYVETNMLSLLTNLVVLDISRNVHDFSNELPVKDSILMEYLSKMLSLKSLDVSYRDISDTDVQLFDQPHHRMIFLGLFNTTPCSRQNINADQV